MVNLSGLALVKMALPGNEKYPIGWPELAKVMLASALGAFTLRGGIGLGKMVGRRLTHPIEPLGEEEEEVVQPEPAPKYASEKQGVDKGMHPLTASALGLLMGGGGAFAGWKLADKLVDRRRMSELESEIERKKKEYEDLLLGKPTVELRIPKVASVMESFADDYEEGIHKEADISLMKALPYGVYLTLAALIANEAYGSFKGARGASEIEQKLRLFRQRPRRRVLPARAVLSQPRQTPRESLTSATRLPKPARERMEREELEEDPTRGR